MQLNDCLGKTSCTLHLNSSYVPKNISMMNIDKYIFVNAICKETMIQISSDSKEFKIKKSTIATMAAICDSIAILIFLIGIQM